jgi:hypothetical protein
MSPGEGRTRPRRKKEEERRRRKKEEGVHTSAAAQWHAYYLVRVHTMG